MAGLDWEGMPQEQKAAIKALSEHSFLGFQRIFYQLLQGDKWMTNWHHRYMADRVEKIISRECGNTIFNVPPGSSKTETLSIHAPVWSTLKVRKVRNLNLSFSDSLGKRNSRRSKEIIKSQEFRELWPVAMGVDQASEWQLMDDDGKTKAEVISRSMGGDITGSRGGHPGPEFSGWVCLDDPDKPDSMFSDVKRKKSHDILVNTVRSRRGDKSREHPTPILLIQQRLHVDDSTAFLLAGGMGMDFDLISIPALINDEYIQSLPEPFRTHCIESVCHTDQIDGYWSYWPENEDIRDLMALREANPYTFASQYMQAPEALEGEVFRSDDFSYYNDPDGLHPLPRMDYRFIIADTAQKTGERNDYTVFGEWGFSGGNLYRLNWWRAKVEADKLRSSFESFCHAAWAKNGLESGNLRDIYVEDKSSGTGLIQELAKRLPLPITAVQRSKDKLTRAMDVQPHHRAGKIYLPYGDAQNYEMVSEVASFRADGTHKHDDQCDVMMDAINVAIIQPQTTAATGGLMIPKRLRR